MGNGSLFGAGMFNQYLLILGEFNNEGIRRINEDYENSSWIRAENYLSIYYFFGQTFITQIVILNMLIAIMVSTFDRHNEDLD